MGACGLDRPYDKINVFNFDCHAGLTAAIQHIREELRQLMATKRQQVLFALPNPEIAEQALCSLLNRRGLASTGRLNDHDGACCCMPHLQLLHERVDGDAGGPDTGAKRDLLSAAIWKLNYDSTTPYFLDLAIDHGLDSRPALHTTLNHRMGDHFVCCLKPSGSVCFNDIEDMQTVCFEKQQTGHVLMWHGAKPNHQACAGWAARADGTAVSHVCFGSCCLVGSMLCMASPLKARPAGALTRQNNGKCIRKLESDPVQGHGHNPTEYKGNAQKGCTFRECLAVAAQRVCSPRKEDADSKIQFQTGSAYNLGSEDCCQHTLSNAFPTGSRA